MHEVQVPKTASHPDPSSIISALQAIFRVISNFEIKTWEGTGTGKYSYKSPHAHKAADKTTHLSFGAVSKEHF